MDRSVEISIPRYRSQPTMKILSAGDLADASLARYGGHLSPELSEWLNPHVEATLSHIKVSREDDGIMMPVGHIKNLDATNSPVAFDVRRSLFRLRIWGAGLYHLIRQLAFAGVIPKAASDYADDHTNLPYWNMHERLIELDEVRSGIREADYDKLHAQPADLASLRRMYELRPNAKPEHVNARVAYQAAMGLWTARRKDERDWQITIGPISKAFHMSVFIPAMEYFEAKLIAVRDGAGDNPPAVP